MSDLKSSISALMAPGCSLSGDEVNGESAALSADSQLQQAPRCACIGGHLFVP